MNLPEPVVIKTFITDDATAKAMVEFADQLGRHLKEKKVTTSQIRNAYGNMKKLEMADWQESRTLREVLLLKPRLAYAARRQRNNNDQEGLQSLKTTMDSAIDAVTTEEQFKRFCQFFEAIIAYHKAAGGD
ncbi:MAG: type III-A CRISPR-associated protein Csm2 [Synechococcaceae cyanobacterium SM1_2_3]|nr:type III-A CRISPR-associated protein Csm2 [Synechococcaceae cyanobacterium SM1_2_3]